MLLSARKILLIHFLMRLPDFVRPAVDAADRIVQRFVESKLLTSMAGIAVINRPIRARCFQARHRGRMPLRLPRSDTHEA